jgi:hypothetical protein
LFGAKGASLLLFDRTHDALELSAAHGLSETYRINGIVNSKYALARRFTAMWS